MGLNVLKSKWGPSAKPAASIGPVLAQFSHIMSCLQGAGLRLFFTETLSSVLSISEFLALAGITQSWSQTPPQWLFTLTARSRTYRSYFMKPCECLQKPLDCYTVLARWHYCLWCLWHGLQLVGITLCNSLVLIEVGNVSCRYTFWPHVTDALFSRGHWQSVPFHSRNSGHLGMCKETAKESIGWLSVPRAS